MALIRCPECKEKVSDKATSCPKCGYPLQQARTLSLSDVLVGRRWQARSHTLAGQGLVITFMRDGQFNGQLTGTAYMTPPQQVKGKWQVIESQLFLDYVYSAQVDSGFTTQVVPTSAQIQIQITQASESKLLGVDQFVRQWEWERIG
jgi:zinc-ribbon domain